jgi:hypothetical protein
MQLNVCKAGRAKADAFEKIVDKSPLMADRLIRSRSDSD